jgi:hypothetical protein
VNDTDSGVPIAPVAVDAHPESRVHNSQPHGIGRVVALPDLVAWNNLGRNVVFANADLRPRAVFDESAFAEDEPSQFDLDVHAILDVPGCDLVVTMNHYGMVRAFRGGDVRSPRAGPITHVTPVWMRTFVADVERLVVAGSRLVGSRPREEGTPGLLVSDPLSASGQSGPFDASVTLEEWRPVRALAALDGPGLASIAVGGDAHIGSVTLDHAGLATMRWETPVAFEPVVIVAEGDYVWAAGSAAGVLVDDYDWEARHGGGFAALHRADGRVAVQGTFPRDLAWGTGGIPLALVPVALCGLGRRGEWYLFDRRDGSMITVTAPITDSSLGIAHCAAIGNRLVYGFNRGGYRLWTASTADAGDATPGRRRA